MKSCLTRDELIEKMKREGVCEEPPYESAFDRRCIVKQKNKSLDPEILEAIVERERQNRPPALDKASYKKWFKRAETTRQMGMTCTAYIDDELPTVIGTALGERGCNETLNRDEINGVRQTVSRELQSEYDKTKNGKWDEKWDNSPWVSVFDICPSHSFL